MNVSVIGRMSLGAARYRLTGRRVPLTVFASVTNRCESMCTHCTMPMRTQKELSTRELLDVIDAFADRGTQQIVLSGGEPLTRRDLPEIVARCVGRAMYVQLETNGYRYPELAGELSGLGRLVVGYEGDEEAHDAIREPGSWRLARAALDEAVRRGVPTATLTTLTCHNLDAIGHVLDTCEQKGLVAEFRLLHHNPVLDGGASCELAPSDAGLRRALRQLVEWRRQGRPVATTEKTLRSLLSWEDYTHIASPLPREDQVCLAAQTHCYLDADGSLYACRQRLGQGRGGSIRELGFDGAWDQIRGNDCQSCVVADLCERNHLDNLNPPALLGLAHNVSRRRRRSGTATMTGPGGEPPATG